MNYAQTVLDLVGNTPLVKLNKVTDGIQATVLAKIEYLNVDSVKIIPYPATKNRVLEAVLEARDKTEKALTASAQLKAFALAPSTGASWSARQEETSRESAAPRDIVWVPILGGSFMMGSERVGEGPARTLAVMFIGAYITLALILAIVMAVTGGTA